MASERDPTSTGEGAAGKREGFPVRLVLLGLLGLYLILFVVLNAKSVTVSFVLFSTRVSLIVALVLASVLGFLAGYLGRELRGRRGRS